MGIHRPTSPSTIPASRQELERALRQTEERFRRLLETTKAIPWEADARTWRFTYVGPQAVDLLGYPLERWFEPDFWADHIHPRDRQRALDYCLTSSRCEADYDFEYRMIAADGSVVWLHDLVSVTSEDGEPVSLRGFMVDTTDRKRAEEDSRERREELAHLSRVAALGELAGSLAHELKQPLAAIRLSAETGVRLLRGRHGVEAVLEALKENVESVDRATEMIRGMEALFKKGPLKKETLDLNEVIREVVALVRNEASVRHVSVRSELAADLPPVRGEHVLIQQVLVNLILNGSEAMSEASAEGHDLWIRSRVASDGCVEVEVSDSGVGLDAQTMARMFDPFFTSKPAGLGMGLSISRSIVEEHGGRLWATPNPEGGATLHFSLPSQPPVP